MSERMPKHQKDEIANVGKLTIDQLLETLDYIPSDEFDVWGHDMAVWRAHKDELERRIKDHARLLAEKEAEVAHAADVLRLVGEFIEGGETTYYCRGYGDCCVFCDAVDTYDDPIEHDNDCIWAKLLAAARKMKEQR